MIWLLQNNALSAESLHTSLCGLYNLVLEIYNLQISFRGGRLVAHSLITLLH